MSIEFIKTREQDGVTWLWVEPTQWLSTHQQLLSDGAVRFEWLTATHNLGDEFVLTTCVANETLAQRWIVNSTVLDAQIASVVGVYPLADFHEREVEQMFGVIFNGVDSRDPAFVAQFAGHPLRRDFQLEPRVQTPWPGAVEPDENARRRASLPPGVFSAWSK